MIQFNLLPDVKIQYLKAKRQEHAVVLGSVVAIVASVAVFVLLLSVVHVLQKKSISDLSNDIKVASTQLQETDNLNKILTVQNQLNSLPALHDKKVLSSKLFTYMSQVTPSNASISQLDVDFTLNTMTLNGAADTLNTVNKFTDTLKFTKFKSPTTNKDTNAFTSVVLSGFTRDLTTATYTITLKFDPLIFTGTKEVSLTVPKIISTRSEVDKPTALFQEGAQ